METGSALALTVASVVGLLPQAIIRPFAGVWINRFNRKRIMISADATVAISSLYLSMLFLPDVQSIQYVYVVLFIRALGETFYKPAMQALIPQLVPSSELTKAGGFGQMINSACSVVGPMLGALIMSITTLPYVMLVNVVGALFSIITLSLVKVSRHTMNLSSKLNVIEYMKQGLMAIKSNKAVLRLSITTTFHYYADINYHFCTYRNSTPSYSQRIF